MSPTSDPAAPEIVLTDARGQEVERLTKKSPCPRCEALPAKRVVTAGFGRVRPVVCGVCGFEFPPEAVA